MSLWIGPFFWVLALDAEAAKFILKDPRFIKYPSPHEASVKAIHYFQSLMTNMNGEDWRRHRSFMNPGFSKEALSRYYKIYGVLTDKAISTIPENEDLETSAFSSRFTLDVLGKSVFNYDFGRIERKNDKIYDAYRLYLKTLNYPIRLLIPRFFSILENLPIKAFREYDSAIDSIIKLFEDMIERNDESDGSILSELLKTQNSSSSDKPVLSRREFIANIWLLFLAGHETTAGALTYCFNTLRVYPEIQEKLHLEIKEKIGLENFPTEEELSQLDYLDAFLQESLRLHSPAVALNSRIATVDIPYNGMIIPKGALVGPLFHAIQTNPEIWEDPLVFKPERWSNEEKKGRNRYAYIPFSMGSRECLGKSFALQELRVFLARFLQKHKVIDPVNSKGHPVDVLLQIGGDNKVPVRIVKRN